MEKIKQKDNRFLIGKRIPLTASFSKNMSLITSFWQSFQQDIKRYHLQQKKPFEKYGITFREQSKLYYACCLPADITYPDDFEIFLLPRSHYFLYEHVGPMRKLPDTIQYLMKQHLPAAHLTPKQIDLVYYEAYRPGFAYQDEHSVIEIGIPILQDTPDHMPSISAKSLLQGNGKPTEPYTWFGMDYNMNLYKGCPHGCIYCDSRSSCYQVDNFDIVRKKENELSILEMELKRKKRKGVIGIGSMSDTYHPFEKTEKITHGALELIYRYGFGVGIDTKSDLILKDIDLISAISKQYPSIVKITITTADDTLCRIIEPHVCVSSKRFIILEKLHQANIFAGILMMPILPFINDSEENIKTIIEQAHLHHAKFIYPGFGVTLRLNQRSYFYYQLDRFFPGKRQLYEKYYHNTYSCESLHHQALWKLFQKECQKYGILYRMNDIIHAYKKETGIKQMSLL
ncbi:radical SAM protein [Absiella sp. AM54-8XD]|uniref:radical SAM protein n=1 Tax=unclassified Amedibacterium TaxID=3088137 RepID=UPI000E403769|nr:MULTISPECIES: radical SAM protein [unclassified Absiella]RGC19690.1 radical SAM protein [Absiella sp. AM54-8XD]RGC51429.1 radical SAM protein [Absiella sp. AM29-15]